MNVFLLLSFIGSPRNFSSCDKTFCEYANVLLPPDGQPPASRSTPGLSTLTTALSVVEDYAEIVDEDGDYSSPARDYELERWRVDLQEIIGEGQFGDVHRGVYTSGSDVVHVAVKTCKVEGDDAMTEKFLEEACMTN